MLVTYYATTREPGTGAYVVSRHKRGGGIKRDEATATVPADRRFPTQEDAIVRMNALNEVLFVEAEAMESMDEDAQWAAWFMGMRARHTGGGCVALALDMSDGEHLLVTSEGAFPTRLTDPVDARRYDADGEPVETADPNRYDTLAAFILDVYGPEEGCEVPEPLRPCRDQTGRP